MIKKYPIYIPAIIISICICLVLFLLIVPRGAPTHPAEIDIKPQGALSVSDATEMLRDGALSIIPAVSVGEARLLGAAKNASVLRSEQSGTLCAVFFNTRTGPCKDIAFRQALAFAVDRDYIVKTLLSGMVNSCKSFVPIPGSWTNDGAPAPDFNSIQARQLLDKAGYTLDGGLKARIDPATGKALQLTILTPEKASSEALWDIGYTLDYYLNAMGVKSSHIALPDNELSSRAMVKRAFDIVIEDVTLAKSPYGLYALLHSSRDMDWTADYSGIHDSALDKSLETLWTANDLNAARQASLDAQARISQLLPYVPVCTVPIYSAVGTAWDGAVMTAGSGADTLWTYLSIHNKNAKNGGILTVASSGSMDDLNPLTANSAAEWKALKLIYSPLIDTDPKTLEITPVLAESWIVADWKAPGGVSGMVVTFKLKSGVKWQDGVDFTSEDIKFCIDYLKKNSAEIFSDVTSKIDHADAPDKQTVEIYITDTGYRNVTSLAWLTFLPKHIWDGVTDYRSFKPWTEKNPLDAKLSKLVGQGPYILAAGDSSGDIKLIWNSGYTLMK